MTRYERFREGLAQRDCRSAVLVGPSHAVHLAGYSRYLSSATAVVLAEDGTCTLVVPRYELEAAAGHADAVVAYGDDGFLDFDWLPKLVAACRELCRGGSASRASARSTVRSRSTIWLRRSGA